MSGSDKPEVQPNPVVFGLVFLVGIVIFGFLFNNYGFVKLPTGTAQEIAAYYGTRMIPIGVALTLVGFAAAIASTAGAAFGKVVGGTATIGPASFGLGDITDLLKAAASLSATPAGIGVLLTIVGVALLVGSGFAATATVPTS